MANFGYIQITRACNQECVFCSNPPMEGLIELNEAKKVIDDYKKANYKGIIWTGGEPTLYPFFPELIAYAKSKKINSLLITNGQKTANFKYLKSLTDAGLNHVEISFHSHIPRIQNYLSGNKNSFNNLVKTINNLKRLKIETQVITVINSKNANHLSKIVIWFIKKYPHIKHFIWNNIDPTMNRAAENKFIIPRLNDFEMELKEAMDLLIGAGKTFRAERIPLCYMADYAQFSTETRKIVKKEERSVHFLDKKGRVRQTNWSYKKTDCCKICFFNKICAGLWEMDKYYDSKELSPIFLNPEIVINKIKEGGE